MTTPSLFRHSPYDGVPCILDWQHISAVFFFYSTWFTSIDKSHRQCIMCHTVVIQSLLTHRIQTCIGAGAGAGVCVLCIARGTNLVSSQTADKFVFFKMSYVLNLNRIANHRVPYAATMSCWIMSPPFPVRRATLRSSHRLIQVSQL